MDRYNEVFTLAFHYYLNSDYYQNMGIRIAAAMHNIEVTRHDREQIIKAVEVVYKESPLMLCRQSEKSRRVVQASMSIPESERAVYGHLEVAQKEIMLAIIDEKC